MGKCEYNGRSPVGNADPTQTPRTGPTGLDTRLFEVGEGATAEGQPRELNGIRHSNIGQKARLRRGPLTRPACQTRPRRAGFNARAELACAFRRWLLLVEQRSSI